MLNDVPAIFHFHARQQNKPPLQAGWQRLAAARYIDGTAVATSAYPDGLFRVRGIDSAPQLATIASQYTAS